MKTYSQYFVSAQRADESSFIKLKEVAPEELRDFIRNLHFDHFGCLPNDWIYDVVDSAFSELENSENDIDRITIEPDPYDYDLKIWFLNPFANAFCEEYKATLSDSTTIMEWIAGGQWLAKDTIYRAVSEFLNKNKMGVKNGQ
jgi:hypothetical protein